MTFTHALSSNNYGPAKFIVSTSQSNGTHTTLAAAMTAASSGDTIFLRDSVTENVTITPGVNIVGWDGGQLNTPSITGKLTMTGAGTSTISNIRLITNSDNFLAVTGSSASIIFLKECYLDCSNNTGITYSSSSSSSSINIYNCYGNIETTGITYWSFTSAGTITLLATFLSNNGATSTASTNTSGVLSFFESTIGVPLSISSSSANSLNANTCTFDSQISNSTVVTTSGTGTSSLLNTVLSSGTASAISVGVGTTLNLYNSVVITSNTNAITGAGTLNYGTLDFTSSKIINTTTQTNVNSSTFTPAVQFGGGATGITYATQTGKYYRSGNTVYFSIDITLSNKGSSTGGATIAGLPFTSASTPAYDFVLYITTLSSAPASTTYNIAELSGSGTSVTLFAVNGGTGASTQYTNTHFANNTTVRCTGTYLI